MSLAKVIAALVERGEEDLANELLVLAALDIQVHGVGFASGQEPDQGGDTEFASLMNVEFTLSGQTVARLFEKQMRVLEPFLKKLDKKKAIRALEGRKGIPILKEVFKQAKPKVLRELQAEIEDTRGVKVQGIEMADDQNFAEAKIDIKKGTIKFEIEIDVMGKWTGKW